MGSVGSQAGDPTGHCARKYCRQRRASKRTASRATQAPATRTSCNTGCGEGVVAMRVQSPARSAVKFGIPAAPLLTTQPARSRSDTDVAQCRQAGVGAGEDVDIGGGSANVRVQR